ncbi:MAG: CYTH domain-containing protein [Alphaproteobacteria bacterium]|nr:CYTH domain-containing protein [Alphaproteobacteria bacterium]
MAVETERKFLTISTDWMHNSFKCIRLRDGLIASIEGRKVRVRVADQQAYLTIKGARVGYSRDEFEYEIPLNDAERLLERHCAGLVVTKTRHFVKEGNFVFEVDVYDGVLEGVTIAEAELSSPEETFPRPAWLGEEVTGREEYRKINMLRARLRAEQ